MTNYRAYGDMPFSDFEAELARMKSPMLAEARQVYDEVKGHSRLFLAMAFHETKLGTLFTVPGFDASFKNPVALMSEGKYLNCREWAIAANNWADRLIHSAATYKGGVYARATTLEDLIAVYAPASAGNDEARYVAVVKERLAAYGYTETPPMPITFGRVENPGFFDRPIWKVEGNGQNYLGDRVLKFMVLHRMVGTLDGTDGYFRMASTQALTDWGVGTAYTDGKPGWIYKWNSVDTGQSGWASGPWEWGSPKGTALYNKLGINAINRDGESVEVSGVRYDDPIDDTTWEEIAELIAWRADGEAKIPYTSWPINPATGLHFLYEHHDFQNHKPCCGDLIRAKMPWLVKRVGEILKEAQTGGTPNQPGTVTPAPAVIFVAFPKKVVFHTVPMATARQYGSRDAKIIRTFKDRTAIRCGGYYLGESVNGDNRWLVIVSGKTSLNARIHASGVEEDIPTFSAATKGAQK